MVTFSWGIVLLFGAVILVAALLAAAIFLAMGKPGSAIDRGELADLREEVARLREEVERLKAGRAGPASTHIK